MTLFEAKFQPLVISQSQYDEIMKTGVSLDWDGSPIIWDHCTIDLNGRVVSADRDCRKCRFRSLNQFWGCCFTGAEK